MRERARHGRRAAHEGARAAYLLRLYDNAFAILREAYAALASDPSRPFKTIEDALVAHNDLDTMEQRGDGSWSPWNIPLPPLPGRPGDPFTNPQAFAYRSLIERLGDRVQALHDHDPVLVGGDVLAKYDKVKSASDAVLTDRLATAEKPFAELQRSLRALQESLLKMRGGERKADLATRRGERKANLALAGMSTTLGHLWILTNLAAATALGMAVDGLIYPTRQSVAAVNALEYRAWLSNYLATSETVNSAVVCAMYDTVFAYPGGDNTQSGDVEAGSAVLTQKGLVSYRGPAAWKMRTGTGDVTAAPLFQVLQQRGVQVNFFRRVDDLAPGAGGTIDTITIGVQATTPNSVPYKPLINVKGVEAWPDRPLYGQLNEGSQLSLGDYDLEILLDELERPGQAARVVAQHRRFRRRRARNRRRRAEPRHDQADQSRLDGDARRRAHSRDAEHAGLAQRADGMDGRPRAGRHRLRLRLRSTHGSTGRS